MGIRGGGHAGAAFDEGVINERGNLAANIFYGLWYPIVVALATVVLGFLLVKEGKDVDINA